MNEFYYQTLEELKEQKENLIATFTNVHDDELEYSEDELTEDRAQKKSPPRRIGVHKRFGLEKDGLAHATSWNRAFHDLFTRLSWLNGFSDINKLASEKILKKFKKVFFHKDQNNPLVDKLLEVMLDDKIHNDENLTRL